MELPLIIDKTSIGELARYNPNSIAVFQKYGIDFYCKGNCLLSEACAACGCDESTVLEELAAMSSEISGFHDFNDWSIDTLIEYIIDNHHQYVNQTVPEIAGLFQAVSADSSVQSADIKRANELFRMLANDMKQHMQKEELGLFPVMKKLETFANSGVRDANAGSVSVKSLIAVVEMEHDTSAIILKQIGGFRDRLSKADDPGDILVLLVKKLIEFEADLIMHINVENNVLHKKAIELEQLLMN